MCIILFVCRRLVDLINEFVVTAYLIRVRDVHDLLGFRVFSGVCFNAHVFCTMVHFVLGSRNIRRKFRMFTAIAHERSRNYGSGIEFVYDMKIQRDSVLRTPLAVS